MKKQLLKLLVLCLALCTALCVFTACGGTGNNSGNTGGNNGSVSGGVDDGTNNGGDTDGDDDTPAHTCVFDKQVVAEKYKKSDATCKEKATYYLSCECGEKGTDTFEHGNLSEHVFDKEVATEDYKQSDATCKEKAKYYLSCECGEKGTDSFEYGDLLEHVFDKEIVTEDCKESDATCKEKAKYYLSCECGEKGTDFFERGDLLEHEYVENKCKWCEKTISQGLEYTLINNDTEYEVSGIGICNDLNIVIPSTYENKPVTSIGYNAFYNCKLLTNIEIPTSVISIGRDAFENCLSLTSIVIPNSVTTIGGWAFAGCTSLIIHCEVEGKLSDWFLDWNSFCPVVWDCNNNDVATDGYIYTVVDGLRYSIKDNVATVVAQPKNITTANIPTSITYKGATYPVTSIGDSAFYSCNLLESITFAEGTQLTRIGYDTFYNCDSLEEVEIPASVTSIDSSAFYSCDSLTRITLAEGSQLTSIGYNAFYNCSSLEEIELPDCVKSIGAGAFGNCKMLTSIVIPNSVTSMGGSVFENCDLIVIYCEAERAPSGWGYSWNKSSGPIVWNCKNNDLATNGKIYTIVDGVRYSIINEEATVIKQLKNIAIANIPSSIQHKGNTYPVTSIIDEAFSDCTLLTSVVINNGVKSIGSSAFSKCTSLTNVSLGTGISYIKYSAFAGCSALTSIRIPLVGSIYSSAFSGCDALTIYCVAGSKPKDWDNEWNYNYTVVWNCNYNDVATDGYIYTVVDGLRYGIKDNVATVVKQPKNITTANIPTSITYKGATYPVTGIGNNAFSYCKSLEAIEIPVTLTTIGNYAFDSCSSLQTIEIPATVTTIGGYAFRNCSSLTIYCEAESEPSGWVSSWNYSNRPVVWGYTGESD